MYDLAIGMGIVFGVISAFLCFVAYMLWNTLGNGDDFEKIKIFSVIFVLIGIGIGCMSAISMGTSYVEGDYPNHSCRGYNCDNECTYRFKSSVSTMYYCDEHYQEGYDYFVDITNYKGSGSSNKSGTKTCKVCDRTFSDWDNFNNIKFSGMCNQCEKNYNYATE